MACNKEVGKSLTHFLPFFFPCPSVPPLNAQFNKKRLSKQIIRNSNQTYIKEIKREFSGWLRHEFFLVRQLNMAMWGLLRHNIMSYATYLIISLSLNPLTFH